MDNQNQHIVRCGVVLPLISLSAKLDFVRNTFLLDMDVAAKVFRVQKAALVELAVQQPIEDSWSTEACQRLEVLFELSQRWGSMGPLTGRWTTFELSSGHTLIELLSAEMFDPPAILNAHDELAAAAPSLRKAEHDRTMAAVNALKPAFEKLSRLQEQRRKS